MTSAMAAEIAEIPAAVARLLAQPLRLPARRFAFAVVCGRGSSGHAGVHLRYLIETRLAIACAAAAPSTVTAYGAAPAMRDALFVVISQSGGSPDLVAVTAAARAAGAATVALVNEPASPVAASAEFVLPLAAGRENSIAATKSVVAAMAAGARLVAALAHDAALDAALRRLPARLVAAGSLDWSAWTARLAAARAAIVTARGYGYAAAREIALKVAETLRLPAIGHSAAELRHGPRAAIAADTPVLALRQCDATAEGVDTLVGELRGAGVPVAAAGGPLGDLPWLADDAPELDPVAMLVPAYRAIEAAARARGFDPDRPPFLAKVTRTL